MTNERELFETAYQELFPMRYALNPRRLKRDEYDDYEETVVNVAWHMWQARAKLSENEK